MKLVKKLLVIVTLSLFCLNLIQASVFAAPLSSDELQALNGWPNWVADNGTCSPSTSTSSPGSPSSETTVVIDPGHGVAGTETDPTTGIIAAESVGAPGERKAMWETAQIIKTQLETAGYKVVLTKTKEDDTAGLLTKVQRANDSGANIAVSLHYTGDADFTASNDHWGVTPQEVGLFRENKANGKRKTFTNQTLATKSTNYAQVIADERKAVGIDSKVVPLDMSFPKSRTDIQAWGNISIVQLFATIPWVYNEVGNRGFDKNKYADSVASGIKKAVPLGVTNTNSQQISSGCSCSSGSNTSTLSGNNNIAIIWNYFIGKGLTPKQTAGIMGNISVESGETFSPTIQEGGQNPPYGGYGIAQWTGTGNLGDRAGARRLNLIKYLQTKGLSVNLTTQTLNTRGLDQNNALLAELDYLWQEGAGSVALIRSETTIAGAAESWLNSYERPLVRIQPERAARGKIIYDHYKNSTPTPVSSSSASACANSLGTGITAAIDLAIKYAWTTHNHQPQTEMKPTYKAAFQAAQSSGQYVGGITYPGVDCGGFITRVMIDSGADPGYNYGGKLPKAGPTSKQQQYLDEQVTAGKYTKVTDTNKLQPGDIAINSQHTYMYIGDQHPANFLGNSVSASLDSRAPSASNLYLSNDAGPFSWYRLVQ